MRNEWRAILADWVARYQIVPLDPQPTGRIREACEAVNLPTALVAMYAATNGFGADRFQVLPIQGADSKRTWNSVVRANTVGVSPFLAGDRDLLSRFAIFADLGYQTCAAVDRATGPFGIRKATNSMRRTSA